MKGNPEVITMLNVLLASEHTAIQQYSTHAAMCRNWGYEKLEAYLIKRKNQEVEHANELMDRILFLGGDPNFAKIDDVKIGQTVEAMFEMDQQAELTAIADYTEAINVAVKYNDFGTRKLFEHILEEEDEHLNQIESNMSQIEQAGIGPYLAVQIEN